MAENINGIITATLTVLLIGILIGVGVMLLDEFGDATQITTTVSEDITVTSGRATFANDEVVNSATTFEMYNETSGELIISNNLSDATDVNMSEQDGTLITSLLDGNDYNVTYQYLADSSVSTVIDTSRNNTDDFVTWLPVIIIIIAAAIILGLILKGFKQ